MQSKRRLKAAAIWIASVQLICRTFWNSPNERSACCCAAAGCWSLLPPPPFDNPSVSNQCCRLSFAAAGVQKKERDERRRDDGHAMALMVWEKRARKFVGDRGNISWKVDLTSRNYPTYLGIMTYRGRNVACPTQEALENIPYVFVSTYWMDIWVNNKWNRAVLHDKTNFSRQYGHERR